jgi:hypothetical protein
MGLMFDTCALEPNNMETWTGNRIGIGLELVKDRLKKLHT